VALGYQQSKKSLRSGKAKLILIAANTPPLRKSEIECRYRGLTAGGGGALTVE